MDSPSDIPEVCSIRSEAAEPPRVRGNRVILLLILVWIVGMFDLMFTLLALNLGNFVEANPIAAGFIHDTEAIVAFKIGALGLATVILLKFRRHRFTEFCSWVICAVHTLLAFLWLAYYFSAS